MFDRVHFAFLSVGHFFNHLFLLIFATVAALYLSQEWGMSYAALIPYATPGFVAFGACTLPAGWLADKWSRTGMMVIFFIGTGLSSAFTSMAQTPLQIGIGLLFIGVFAAVYHPVGLALVVQGRKNTGVPLAINGIFGNMGVACAALITGFLIDHAGWRWAFILPGVISVLTGIGYAGLLAAGRNAGAEEDRPRVAGGMETEANEGNSRLLIRVFSIVFFSTSVGGLVYQSTTFALPKVFDERLTSLAVSATIVGWYAFVVFAVAAFGQIVVGYLVDRFSIRSVFAVVAALQALFFAVMPGLSGWSALAVSMAFMLAVFGQIPINDVIISRLTRSEWRSRVYAVRYIVTFSVMASSVPFIAWIHANWGFDSLFRVLAAGAMSVMIAVLILPKAVSTKRSL